MIEHAIEWIAVGVDAIGVAVILFGFVIAVGRTVPILVQTGGVSVVGPLQSVRCDLGTYLVFALELMIVSDLLHSVISRSLDDLYFLAGIVILRTVISYFLGKEIEEIHAAETAS